MTSSGLLAARASISVRHVARSVRSCSQNSSRAKFFSTSRTGNSSSRSAGLRRRVASHLRHHHSVLREGGRQIAVDRSRHRTPGLRRPIAMEPSLSRIGVGGWLRCRGGVRQCPIFRSAGHGGSLPQAGEHAPGRQAAPRRGLRAQSPVLAPFGCERLSGEELGVWRTSGYSVSAYFPPAASRANQISISPFSEATSRGVFQVSPSP